MYSKGIYPEQMSCPHCGVAVDVPPEASEQTAIVCKICKKKVPGNPDRSQLRLVTVYVPKNESEHLAAQALLKSASIDFFSKNFTVQNLFGMGQIGTGYNIVTGPIQIQVPEEVAEEAREMLEDYFSVHPAVEDITDSNLSENRYLRAQQTVDRMTTRAMLFCIFWFGGLGASIAIYYALKSLRLINESDERLSGKALSFFALVLASLEIVISPYLWIKILEEWRLF